MPVNIDNCFEQGHSGTKSLEGTNKDNRYTDTGTHPPGNGEKFLANKYLMYEINRLCCG